MLQATKLIVMMLAVIVAVLLILIVVGVLAFDDLTENIGKILAIAGIVLAVMGVITVLSGGNGAKGKK